MELQEIREAAATEFASVSKTKKLKNRTQEPNRKRQERDDRYTALLDRIFPELEKKHNVSKKISIPAPKITREAKKTFVSNFGQICQTVGRPMEHVQSHIAAELICETSIDANHCLILRSMFKPQQIENVLKSYLLTYARCTECGRYNTTMKKDENTRLTMLECKDCLSCKAIIKK
jgi:translation initiation factor 2 beta subunit (eIF-2beta)/eIF-5